MLNIRKKNIDIPKKNNLRKSQRISLKAIITIKNIGNTIVAKGRCIDASLDGLGLVLSYQAKKILSSKDRLKIFITLLDNPKQIQKSGRIVWYKKNRFFTYRSGIEFE